MKQVDIIISSGINHIGGPLGTLKRILTKKNYFESRGYIVSVFTFDSVKSGPFEDISMVPTARPKSSKVTWRMKLSSSIRKLALKNKIVTDIIIWKKYKKTKELIKYYVALDRKPDIVQLHSHYDGSYYFMYRKDTTPKTAVFLHSNGIPYDQELSTFPLLNKTLYFKKLKSQLDSMIRQVDLLAFIANVGQKNFLERYPYRSKDDTIVIRNGIDEIGTDQLAAYKVIKEKNNNSTFKYRLCTVGTVSYRKGQRLIIETLHSLPQEVLRNIHVDFVGDGPERPILEDLVLEYKLGEHVYFCGSVPNVEVYKYLAQNNIYILMSSNEGLPISILEAMRVGMPIIGTNVAGIPECIENGYNGFLLEPDEKQLSSLLKKLPEYDWERMGKNSRDKFEREFTFDRMMKEFCDMYDALTETNN